MWIALGLFFTLWWTWIGFSVLYNRFGVDAAPQRLLFLAGSVPTGVAAVAIEPASTGDVGVFAVSLAITRLILAGANGIDGGWQRAAARADRRLVRDLGGAVRRLDLGARAVPVRAVGGRASRSSRARCCTRTASGAARAARARLQGVRAGEPGGGAGRAPLRRALRAVPDHPARRGGGRGGPGVGGRPRGDLRRLGRAGRGDDPRRARCGGSTSTPRRTSTCACSSSRAARPRWRGRSSPSGT